MSKPTTKAAKTLLDYLRTIHSLHSTELQRYVAAIESEALPSVDLLARAIEATAQAPWSAMGSRAHAEAILDWLRGEGS